MRPLSRTRLRSYASAVLVVALATAVASLLRSQFDRANLIMIYLIGVLLAAVRFGRGPGVLASILSVAAFDFFFVPPHLTFAVADTQYLVTFAIMLGTALLVSTLVVRVREHAEEARKRENAAERERTRNAILSSVSHDLRTPLAAITGAASTLLEESAPVGEEVRRELLQSIYDEGRRLDRLVANLLEMTRAESPDVAVRRDWHAVEEVVGAAVARLERPLEGRELQLDVPPDLPLLPLDDVAIELVLVNLLENALKYSPAGSPLAIRAESRNGHVAVEVRDEGPGIPAGDEERIFEKFARGRHATDPGGLGLGLAICRAIVTAHGGAIRVVAGPDRGATFRFTLPIDGAPARAARHAGVDS